MSEYDYKVAMLKVTHGIDILLKLCAFRTYDSIEETAVFDPILRGPDGKIYPTGTGL